MCVLILTAGFVFAANVDVYSRSLLPEEVQTLWMLVILMTLNTAIFLPFGVFNSVVIAYERYIFSKLVGVLATVLAPVLHLILLYMGYGSVGLVLGSTLLNVVTYGLYAWYALGRLKIRPSFKPAGKGLLGEILKFSAFVFLASIVDTLYWTTDKLIIGWAKGTKDTAVYNIGGTFNTYVTGLSSAISGLLIPKLTQMSVKNTPNEEFSRIFIKVGRLQFLIVSFVVSAFVAFGRQFIALWAGPEFSMSYYVALLTMIPVTIPLIQNTGINILYALNRHQFRSVVYACIAVVNVVLTFWWVERYGIIGAAMATCIAYVVGNILIMNWYYHVKIGIDIPLFWKNILKMSPMMFVMGTASWFVVERLPMDNWLVFFGAAAVYTVVYSLMAYFFMMNSYEKDIVRAPLKKVLRKLKLLK
jgi:O-antigen/teichoic acid export membrane protein